MIVVTGASGFIGSSLIDRLNCENAGDIVAVDTFNSPKKDHNIHKLKIRELVDRDNFLQWLDKNNKDVEFIFHLGARTDTREQDLSLLTQVNTVYTKRVWKGCVEYKIPIVYASSAATYGIGELGFVDDESNISSLKPLNPYAVSKHNFDMWAIEQSEKPPFWAGLKFSNVYGPNEYHKSHMASVAFHGYNQIVKNGKISLFKSYNENFKDGEQVRDFIYVKDVTRICTFFLRNAVNAGIYNVGTGNARTFLDLAKCLFSSMGMKEQIDFVEMPDIHKGNYQYYTNARIQKLRNIGYTDDFYTLEDGVEEYVNKYLKNSSLITHQAELLIR